MLVGDLVMILQCSEAGIPNWSARRLISIPELRIDMSFKFIRMVHFNRWGCTVAGLTPRFKESFYGYSVSDFSYQKMFERRLFFVDK